MSDRQSVSLGHPPDDPEMLADGPEFGSAESLVRVCSRHYSSPWFFAQDGGGRFDLTDCEHGTCYWADDIVAAVREVLGNDFSIGSIVSKEWFESRSQWKTTPDPNAPPHIVSLRADYWAGIGLTNEVWTVDDYEVPHEWANCFHVAGYDGLHHGLRHPVGEGHYGVSVFGEGGAQIGHPCFTDGVCSDLDESVRDEFSQRTQITVEGAPAPRIGLNVVR